MKPTTTVGLAVAFLLGTVASAKPIEDPNNLVPSIDIDVPWPTNAAGVMCPDPNFSGGCRFLLSDGRCHNVGQEDRHLLNSISSLIVDPGKRCYFSPSINCPRVRTAVGTVNGPAQLRTLHPRLDNSIASVICFNVPRGGQGSDVPDDTSLFFEDEDKASVTNDEDKVSVTNDDDEVIVVDMDELEAQWDAGNNTISARRDDAALACHDPDFRGQCYVMLNTQKCYYLKRKNGEDHRGRFSSIDVRPKHRCSLWDTDRCEQNIGRVPGIGPFQRYYGPITVARMEDRVNDRTLSYRCFPT